MQESLDCIGPPQSRHELCWPAISGEDDHVLRKQEEVIQESAMMIGDCQKRLAAAHADLTQMLRNEADLSEAEEFLNAAKALEMAVPHF